MILSKLTVVSADAKEVAYGDTGYVFTLLPAQHQSAWAKLKFMPLAKLDRLQTILTEGSTDAKALSKHYATINEFTEDLAFLQAAHIEGWNGLVDDETKEAVLYTREAAIDLILKYPDLGQWVMNEAGKLMEATLETEVESDAKKK